LFASLKVNKADKTIAPGPEHQKIFKVTQIFVDGTQCKVIIELCARVALMVSTISCRIVSSYANEVILVAFCVPSGLGTQILGQARWPSRRHPFRGQR
jgi:hypothetical protein